MCAVILTLLMVSCTPKSEQGLVLRSVNPIGFDWQQLQGQNPPREFSLSLQVENHGAGVTLRKGEGYIFHKGRKVAILTLEQKAEFMRHRNSQVLLNLRCNVARNSHSAAVFEKLKNHSAEDISVGWKIKVRRGILYGKLEQEPIALEELLGAENMERLWQVIDKMER